MKNRKLATVITILVIILAVALSAMLHGDSKNNTNAASSQSAYLVSEGKQSEQTTDNSYNVNSLSDGQNTLSHSRVTVAGINPSNRNNGGGIISLSASIASMGIGFVIVLIIIAVIIVYVILRLIRSLFIPFNSYRVYKNTPFFKGRR